LVEQYQVHQTLLQKKPDGCRTYTPDHTQTFSKMSGPKNDRHHYFYPTQEMKILMKLLLCKAKQNICLIQVTSDFQIGSIGRELFLFFQLFFKIKNVS
jgi:hypothetical protein